MNSKNLKSVSTAIVGFCFILASVAFGDAMLKTSLDLSIEQASEVAKIQKETRNAIRPVRGDLHREERALRRAKSANDAEGIATQEKRIEPLRMKMRELIESEEAQIRVLLTSEQNDKYDEYLKVRDNMAGSSRDVEDIK